MTTPLAVERAAVRDAVAADNAALVALAASCTMEGDVALRIDRAPDFFALSRLEGDACRVGVATDEEGAIVGCVAVARRRSWVNGAEVTTGYVGDLKVHPGARGCGVADALSRWARDVAADLCGEEALVTATVLAGNVAMERRARGPRGTPPLARFGTLAALAVPLLWERRERVAGITVRPAAFGDVERMAALWRSVAPGRQLAAAIDAADLAAWLERAGGLGIEDYLLALDGTGRLLGFLGVWDQGTLKQTRVVGYSPRLALARRAVNIVAPLVGGIRLPAPGGVLPALATVHLCVPGSAPPVLRALVLEAYRRRRGARHAFLTVGLDVRDPLVGALRGLLAQPTRVHAYVGTPRSPAEPSILDGRPLHHETALV
ncbi:MAG TPA: GNAT family N-acetyltransferase [Gemmatimonadaceae bacterium]|nr:GNAT family N-acetyltransferase [Gemmatimonadaceae bacterium]